ncbi:MAG: hypothetical protein V3S47_02620 [Acidobacteriota bacterium]
MKWRHLNPWWRWRLHQARLLRIRRCVERLMKCTFMNAIRLTMHDESPLLMKAEAMILHRINQEK